MGWAQCRASAFSRAKSQQIQAQQAAVICCAYVGQADEEQQDAQCTYQPFIGLHAEPPETAALRQDRTDSLPPSPRTSWSHTYAHCRTAPGGLEAAWSAASKGEHSSPVPS